MCSRGDALTCGTSARDARNIDSLARLPASPAAPALVRTTTTAAAAAAAGTQQSAEQTQRKHDIPDTAKIEGAEGPECMTGITQPKYSVSMSCIIAHYVCHVSP